MPRFDHSPLRRHNAGRLWVIDPVVCGRGFT
jgi:hypothetical protein